jgi:hypothetical protein
LLQVFVINFLFDNGVGVNLVISILVVNGVGVCLGVRVVVLFVVGLQHPASWEVVINISSPLLVAQAWADGPHSGVLDSPQPIQGRVCRRDISVGAVMKSVLYNNTSF